MISFFVIAYYSFDILLDPGMANAPQRVRIVMEGDPSVFSGKRFVGFLVTVL